MAERSMITMEGAAEAARILRELTQTDGSAENVANAGVLAARVRSAARLALVALEPSWSPELEGADRLQKHQPGDVTISIPSALCWLQFTPRSSTGTDPDTLPGVGFQLVAYPGSRGEWPCGVITRTEAARLANALADFLDEHPPAGE